MCVTDCNLQFSNDEFDQHATTSTKCVKELLPEHWLVARIPPHATTSTTMSVALSLICALSEATLAITHSKVLFRIGEQSSYPEMRSRQWYFVWDLASPWMLLSIFSWEELPPMFRIMIVYHFFLHTFYILRWETRHTSRVLKMSSDDAHKRSDYEIWEQVTYFLGTLSDIVVHLFSLAILLNFV
jgi:hypothetical protein